MCILYTSTSPFYPYLYPYARIGNMSHDLKTPMAGIISGLECLENIAKEQLTLPNLTVTHTSSINHMLSIVCNMRSINSFMLLTINRCLDYTKVSILIL